MRISVCKVDLLRGMVMKIGYFVRYFPYEDSSMNERYFGSYGAGGSPKSSYSLVREMVKRNHKVTVFTSSLNSNDSIEEYGNLTINRFATMFRYAGSSLSPRMLLGGLRAQDLDIVHGHLDIPPGPLSALLCSIRTDTPMVLTYHGDWISDYGTILRRIVVSISNMTAVQILLRESDVVISPSARYINESKFLRRVREKTIVVPNGITPGECCTKLTKRECRHALELSSDKQFILFMGSLQPYKGPQILIQAMASIRKSAPNAELLIAGQGWMTPVLQGMCRRLGLENSVHFIGYQHDPARKACLYKSADVFAFPTFSESFGNVALEAMANGVPVVASRVGGVPDVVIDGVTGLLVPPGNPGVLAEAVIRVLENENFATVLGEAGTMEAGKYSWENAAASTEEIYRGLSK